MDKNIEETKRQVAVMQAYIDGATIECLPVGAEYWQIITKPKWNWNDCNYRIAQNIFPPSKLPINRLAELIEKETNKVVAIVLRLPDALVDVDKGNEGWWAYPEHIDKTYICKLADFYIRKKQ